MLKEFHTNSSNEPIHDKRTTNESEANIDSKYHSTVSLQQTGTYTVNRFSMVPGSFDNLHLP